VNESKLRLAFAEICLGYSRIDYKGSLVYIKHFSHFDQVQIEADRERFLQIAKNKRIPTFDEKIEWLIKQELWSKKEDNKIRDLEGYLTGLKKSRANAFIKAQIDEWDKQINQAQNELNEILYKKNCLIGLTAEKYAEQKMEGSHIQGAFFKDNSLKEFLFYQDQYKRLDDEEVEELISIYIEHIKLFSHNSLRKISIAPFFTNYFYLSEDYSKFFAKPLYELTYNQVNLIKYGNYFKSILMTVGDSISEEIRNDPDKLEEWANRSKNAKESGAKHNDKKNGRTAYIGATEKDDGKFLGGKKDDTLSKGEIHTAWDGLKSGKIQMPS
jgi:hypothetical protein